MSIKKTVFVEVMTGSDEAFSLHTAAINSFRESESQIEKLAKKLPGLGVDIDPAYPPMPMFLKENSPPRLREAFSAFYSMEQNPDQKSSSVVLTAQVDSSKLQKLKSDDSIKVYPASRIHLLGCRCSCSPRSGFLSDEDVRGLQDEPFGGLMDLSTTAGGIDCRPFRPGVTVAEIRELLGVNHIWSRGFRGQNVVVALVDEGINQRYPVIGGYAPQNPEELRPGMAPITSHGSMCAADVLVAAPWAKLLDYPLLDEATTADGAQMFQAILERRRLNGTPQVVSNSYGFYSVPSQEEDPEHEVWDIQHPFHRKVREVVASGAAVFFAAGNCGSDCPSGNCRSSSTGPGRSINGSAALAEVMTIAAVNSQHQRIGYSSQGPSLSAPGFASNKPDFAAYSHFFGNFGPGRPGGTNQPFDNGTSAATPVAAGVAALLLSAFPDLTPDRLRAALVAGAIDVGEPGWDVLHGHGVLNAAASYLRLNNGGL